MSLLKNIWRGSSKHKKLSDEWDLATNQDFDGDDFLSSTTNTNYKVKYLGHIPVDPSNNTQETTIKAIDAIISMSKANKKHVQKVLVSVNLKGIEVLDVSTEKIVIDVSIFRICSCLASSKSKSRRVFAFLATDTKETTECHAFLCPKRSVAESMAITVAQAFTRVYQMWQTTRRGSIGTLYYGNISLLQPTPPSYTKHGKEPYNFAELLPENSLSSKWISFDGSLKEPSVRSLAFAEVYVSPPAYSEKPFSDNQIPDSQVWAECNKSADLLVL